MSANTTAVTDAIEKWVSSPDGRGTWDIIIACFTTIFLCCWTSVYPNIPGKKEGRKQQLRDKFGLACLSLGGPEYVMMFAMGQRSSARRSVKRFRDAGYKGWTMKHAFFATMGGFLLKTPDLSEPIPIDADQLFYLIKHNYLPYPNVETLGAEISDRDKSDGLARTLAAIQAVWFVVTVIARGAQSLAVTTLELTTASFVIVLFATAYCWKDKPSDVTKGICFEIEVTTDRIREEGPAGALGPWYHSPLDFISRYDGATNLLYQFLNELVRKVIVHSPFSRRMKAKPWDRIPTDVFLRIDLDLEVVAVVTSLAFSGTFFFAWHAHFPTEFERQAWRVASVYMISFIVVMMLYYATWTWFLLPRWRTNGERNLAPAESNVVWNPFVDYVNSRIDSRSKVGKDSVTHSQEQEKEPASIPGGNKGRVKRAVRSLNKLLWHPLNVSPDKDPHMDLPVVMVVPGFLLIFAYCLLRLYILIEDVVGLRSVSPSVYDTVSWTLYLPHI